MFNKTAWGKKPVGVQESKEKVNPPSPQRNINDAESEKKEMTHEEQQRKKMKYAKSPGAACGKTNNKLTNTSEEVTHELAFSLETKPSRKRSCKRQDSWLNRVGAKKIQTKMNYGGSSEARHEEKEQMEKKKMFLLRSTRTRATDVTIATVLWFDWLKKRQWKILTKKAMQSISFCIL